MVSQRGKQIRPDSLCRSGGGGSGVAGLGERGEGSDAKGGGRSVGIGGGRPD